MARYAQRYLETIATRSSAMDDRVRELIVALLPTGNCSIERVAEHLGCDRRTIHRRLAAQGLSFSEILDAQRAELAMRLIEDRNRSLTAVAGLLGFSAQSALARWFRKQFGCSVSRWRSDRSLRASTG
jgi:AraC-like DNA-binding protein